MPDGPDEYLPGLEPDEPDVEEPSETTAETSEPSKETSGESGDGHLSQHRRSSYDVDPDARRTIPFRLPGDDVDEHDAIDLAASGLPRRVSKDGEPYIRVPPKDHYSWYGINRLKRILREHKTPVIVGGTTFVAVLVAILISMMSPDATPEPVAAAPDSSAAAVEIPRATGSGADESAANSPAPTAKAETTDDIELIDCPLDHQPDNEGMWTSGSDSPIPERKSESDLDRDSNIHCTHTWISSYGFSMTVEGNGEALSQADYTSYQVSFVVNNEWPNNAYYDDTGFSVSVQWNHLANEYTGQVFDARFQPISGTTIDIEWQDQSTLQVIVDLPGDPIDVFEVRTELDVYISDANDQYVYQNRDISIWTAEP